MKPVRLPWTNAIMLTLRPVEIIYSYLHFISKIPSILTWKCAHVAFDLRNPVPIGSCAPRTPWLAVSFLRSLCQGRRPVELLEPPLSRTCQNLSALMNRFQIPQLPIHWVFLQWFIPLKQLKLKLDQIKTLKLNLIKISKLKFWKMWLARVCRASSINFEPNSMFFWISSYLNQTIL